MGIQQALFVGIAINFGVAGVAVLLARASEGSTSGEARLESVPTGTKRGHENVTERGIVHSETRSERLANNKNWFCGLLAFQGSARSLMKFSGRASSSSSLVARRMHSRRCWRRFCWHCSRQPAVREVGRQTLIARDGPFRHYPTRHRALRATPDARV